MVYKLHKLDRHRLNLTHHDYERAQIFAGIIPVVLPKNNLLNKVLSNNVLTKLSKKFYCASKAPSVNKKINLSINNLPSDKATDLLFHLKAKLPYAYFSPSPDTTGSEEFLQ